MLTAGSANLRNISYFLIEGNERGKVLAINILILFLLEYNNMMLLMLEFLSWVFDEGLATSLGSVTLAKSQYFK